MYKLILKRAPILNPSFDGTVKINELDQNGVIHSDVNGALSTSKIINEDIATNANISDNKLAQIMTSGKVANSATTATLNDIPNSIVLRDENGNLADKSHNTIYENISLTNMSYQWTDMSVSSNGQIILATANNNYIYISRDGGDTWKPTLQTITKPWKTCTITKNGNIMIVGTNNEYLYMSKDNGITWSTLFSDANRIWNNIAISDNGTYILAITSTEIINSSDGGNTWFTKSGYSNLTRCVMSSNGQIQVIINSNSNNNQIHISIDYGNTWSNKSISLSNTIIRSIAINNNGNLIRVIDNFGNIHTTTNNFNSTIMTSLFLNNANTRKDINIQTITMDGSGNNATCRNIKDLGTCPPNSGQKHLTMNFNVSPYTGTQGACNKYNWANNCGVSWDGITYGVTNPCQVLASSSSSTSS